MATVVTQNAPVMGTLEPAQTLLIPTCELPPGAISQIRNQVKDALVRIACHEMKLAPSDIVVRDLRWVEDLAGYATPLVASAVNDWTYTTVADATVGYKVVTPVANMATNRYVALFGARDLRMTYGAQQAAATTRLSLPQCVSLIKIDVGGGTRAIWDLSKIQAITIGEMAGITSTAVIIPQNTSYQISYYKCIAVASTIARIVLAGMVVEPRGVVCAP